MLLKEWAFLGNYDFYTNKLKVLATNELPPEKWSYAGKNDFGILRNYLYYTFEKLWQEREAANEEEKQQIIYMDETQLASIPACTIRRGSRSIFTV